MPSAVSGRQCPAESPTKKTPPLGRLAHLVRYPVALVANRRRRRSWARRTVVSLTWKRGSKEPTPIRDCVARREAPAVAGGHVAAVDPDLEIVRAAVGVHLEAARERRVRGLVARPRRGSAASRGRPRSAGPRRRRGPCGPLRPLRPSTLAVSNSASFWSSSRRRARGSRRSRRSRAGGSARCRAGCGPPAPRTPGGSSPPAPCVRARRWGRRRLRSGARRSRSGRAAAPRARAGELAGDGEAGEAGAADDHVVGAARGSALVPLCTLASVEGGRRARGRGPSEAP